MLECKNLSIWYTNEKKIMDHVDFSVDDHRVIGLLGINGAGKTTLINTISGIHTKYEADSILVNQQESDFMDHNFRLSRYTVFTDEQAFQYWTFPEYKNYIEKVYKKRIENEYLNYLLDGFKFGEYQKQFIKNLSTGNKKKVFLITGFAMQLPLLILDEPLDGLDFNSSEFLYEALRQHKKYGSVLMSSHIAESFERTCDKVLLLKQGKISAKCVSGHMDIRRELKGWLDDGK